MTSSYLAVEDIPATDLAWPGSTPEQLNFMRQVYDLHLANARSRRQFVADVPTSDLSDIGDDKQLRTAAAAACRRLLTAARSDLAAQRATGAAAADAVTSLGVASAYRPAHRQFVNWQRNFPKYYDRTAGARADADGGPHGQAAAHLLAAYIGSWLGAPGYSLHNNGLAVDFTTREGSTAMTPSSDPSNIARWRLSWLYRWLVNHASEYGFHPNPNINEPWHWEYSPTATSSEDLVTRGMEVLSTVPLLASHAGSSPDLVLVWNEMLGVPNIVDVVVHLHGFSPSLGRMNILKEKLPSSGLDFVDPAGANIRTRPTLAVLPRGNHSPTSARPDRYDFPALATTTGLNALVDLALSQFGRGMGVPNIRRGRLILTAHSGGGAALMRILSHPANDPDEVHVFDALYGSPDALVTWAERHIRSDQSLLSRTVTMAPDLVMREHGSALRIFFRPGTGTEALSRRAQLGICSALGAGPRAIAPWYQVAATSIGHGDIPAAYGWRLLGDASASVPHTQILPC